MEGRNIFILASYTIFWPLSVGLKLVNIHLLTKLKSSEELNTSFVWVI